MIYLNSSAIRAAHYNEHSQVLAITFVSGMNYDYYGVSKLIYLSLINASSVGEYFNEYIRDKYRSNR